MSKAEDIIQGLGGASNIDEVEGCITRLRVEVRDPEAVRDQDLRNAGAVGVVRSGQVVQVVVGPEADDLAVKIGELL